MSQASTTSLVFLCGLLLLQALDFRFGALLLDLRIRLEAVALLGAGEMAAWVELL